MENKNYNIKTKRRLTKLVKKRDNINKTLNKVGNSPHTDFKITNSGIIKTMLIKLNQLEL
jgi:hypothetical protein